MTLSPLYVMSVDKAFSILDCFQQTAGDLSLTELMRLSSLDKSAVQRYAHTLCELGMLEQNHQTRRYRLGKKVLSQAFDYLRTNAFVESLNPLLLELCNTTGERVSLSYFDEEQMIHVMRHQTNTQEYQASLIGRKVPVFCTSGGRACLAKMSQESLNKWMKGKVFKAYTSDTITDHKKIKNEITHVRSQGYAMVVNEFISGEIALGASITTDQGLPYAAIHLSGSAWEWTAAEYQKRFAPILLNAISRIQRPLRV